MADYRFQISDALGRFLAEKLRKQRAALARLGGHALRTNKLDDLLHEASVNVSKAMEIDLVKVLELLPDGRTMLVRAGVNWNPGVVGHATLGARSHSPAGYALHTHEPVISPDVNHREALRDTRVAFAARCEEHGERPNPR